MRASLPSIEDDFIVSICSEAVVSRGAAPDDMRVSVLSNGLVLQYESLDELVFVLINLSVAIEGTA